MVRFLLLAFVFIFLEAVFLPFNMAVLFLAFGVVLFPSERWPVLAFVLGLVIDLLVGRTLGVTALVFLVMTSLLWLYGKKWSIVHPFVLILFATLTDVLSRVVWGDPIVYWEVAVIGAAAGAFGLWLRFSRGASVSLRV